MAKSRSFSIFVGILSVLLLNFSDTACKRGKKAQDFLSIMIMDPAPEGTSTYSFTLTCHPTGGNHPHGKRACAQLDSQKDGDPFENPDPGESCTEEYDGPESAMITGTWKGRSVQSYYQRDNSCEISRWNQLDKLLLTKG